MPLRSPSTFRPPISASMTALLCRRAAPPSRRRALFRLRIGEGIFPPPAPPSLHAVADAIGDAHQVAELDEGKLVAGGDRHGFDLPFRHQQAVVLRRRRIGALGDD